jgi:nucleoid DNA-binding protein
VNKTDLIRIVSRRTQVRLEVVDEVVDTFLETLARSVVLGENVTLRGFGKFRSRERPPVNLKNPRTGDPIALDARRTVAFVPSPLLKEQMNDVPL